VQILEIAKAAAKAGGEVARRCFKRGVTLRSGKESYNLVSDADVESEQQIGRIIREAFPDDAILGEESHKDDTAADRLWIVDPIDGTNNFAHGVPHFSVSVGFLEQGEPRVGVVYNPIRDEMFTAVRGEGAYLGGERIGVNEHESLDQVLVGVGFYYDRGRMMEATLEAIQELFGHHIHGIRRFGTASLDLCQVACGMFGAFFEYELSPWDIAAGRLILTEAGGRITTALGQPLPLQKCSVLASNGKLHEAMLEIVRPRHP